MPSLPLHGRGRLLPRAAAAQQKADRPQTITAGEQAFVSGAQALVRKGNTMVAILVAVRQQPAQLTASATKLAQAVATHL